MTATPWAALQNISALAATVALALSDKITGEAALVAVLAVTGVIALPALRKGGGTTGTLGVFALAAPAWRLAVILLSSTKA